MLDTRSSRRLLGVNIALLIGLAVVTLMSTLHTPYSTAQVVPNAAQRPRGEYTMISGRYQGSTTAAVYILDAANQEVIALRWDRNNNRFEGIGYHNLKDDAALFRGAR